MLRLRSDSHQAQVIVEQHDARLVSGAGRGTMQQDGLAERMRQLGDKACDERGLRRGEAKRVIGAMQTQVAPALRVGDQGCAQLVP